MDAHAPPSPAERGGTPGSGRAGRGPGARPAHAAVPGGGGGGRQWRCGGAGGPAVSALRCARSRAEIQPRCVDSRQYFSAVH